MKDFTLKKPQSLTGYPIHHAVATLAKGAPHLWRDNGDSVTIRTDAFIDAEGTELPAVQVGELCLFNLRASVNSKIRGHHLHSTRLDNKTRQAWLGRQALRNGFEIVSVRCKGDVQRIADSSGRDLRMDSTEFSGVLRITDVSAFNHALRTGVGSTGKALGFSLLVIREQGLEHGVH